MLYYLHHLSGYLPILNVTRYITFRTAAASLTALAIGLFIGPIMIRKLREFQIGQVIRQEGPATHRKKAGTPTMGGLLILASVLIPTLLWADLANQFVWIAVLATAAFGAIGFADDYLKIVRQSHHGLLPRYKMGWQIVVGIGVGVALIVLNSDEPLQHAADFPVLQAVHSRHRLVLRPVRGAGPGRGDQHGQPDRRPRRPGDQRVLGRRPRRSPRSPMSRRTASSPTTCSWSGSSPRLRS